ncbi:MAG: 1-phosphofructokinase [Armatimonadetes bacterium]|nr:1-phosphofructokinase [Armatimonadota bacterium]
MICTITLNPTIDKTVYVTKLSPNDTNRVTRVEIDAGGKGINCSRMLKRLGAETMVVAFLGGTTGDLVSTVLCREGVPLECVPTDKPTRMCICVEESTGLPPTTFNERGGPVEHRELVALLETAKDVARGSSYMVFGGSVPIGVNQDIYRVLIDIANAGGANAVLDADGEALAEGLKAKPFMIKPNLDELERLLGVEFESQSDVARAALTLAERGIELVVVSLGRQGAIACHKEMIYHATCPEVKCVSTIGSGDSMVAGMLLELDRGAGIEDALRMGCAAGAATAMSNGADIGNAEDAEALASQVKVARIEPSPIPH